MSFDLDDMYCDAQDEFDAEMEQFTEDFEKEFGVSPSKDDIYAFQKSICSVETRVQDKFESLCDRDDPREDR